MEKLAKAMNGFIESGGNGEKVLEGASLVWAQYSLQNYSGELRKKALDVSIAIMDFLDEHKVCTGSIGG